jgi:hypothetical protein
MKNAKGRFIGGFHGLTPFEKHSDIAPLLGQTFNPSPVEAMPKIRQFLESYGIDQKFIKTKTKQGPGITMQPGQGN